MQGLVKNRAKKASDGTNEEQESLSGKSGSRKIVDEKSVKQESEDAFRKK
jgi:hypothetical protein